MSASKPSILLRCMSSMRRLFGFAAAEVAVPPKEPSFADVAFAEIDLMAIDCDVTLPAIAEFSSVAELAAVLSGGIAVVPSAIDSAAAVESATTARTKRASFRPLAAQLAVTAARNVRKGRKSRAFTVSKTRVLKSKPVAKSAVKKRAPKRRHVWLSNQTRVIRPVANNVISLARPTRIATRPAAQRAPARTLRLAA